MGEKKQNKLFKSLLRFQGLISGPRGNLALDVSESKLNAADAPTLPSLFPYLWSVYNALYQKDYRVACFPNGFHSLFMGLHL